MTPLAIVALVAITVAGAWWQGSCCGRTVKDGPTAIRATVPTTRRSTIGIVPAGSHGPSDRFIARSRLRLVRPIAMFAGRAQPLPKPER